MNYGVEICLRELLFEQECVIIPDFGGFLTKYKVAEIDHLANLIYPPRKTVSFNRQLKNDDGLLVNTYRLLNKVSFAEASAGVKKWIADFENRLKENGIAELPKIGTFHWDKNNSTLWFEFDETQNYLAEAYGLPPVNVVPIQRNATAVLPFETKKDQREEPILAAPFLTEAANVPQMQEATESKKLGYSRVVSFVAGAALALVLTLPAFNVHAPNLNLNEAGVFAVFNKWFEPKTINAEPIAFDVNIVSPSATDVTAFIAEANETAADIMKNETVPTISGISDSKYQIVLGAFRVTENAENYVAQIKNEHAELNVIQYKKGSRNFVAIPAGSNEREARQLLEETRASYDCWLKIL